MKTPWHLWVIGVVTLLWNAGGAFDYLMTETRAQWYLDQFTPEQLDYFYGFPPWVVASWAVGVWFAVLGSVLLLVRSRHAVRSLQQRGLHQVADGLSKRLATAMRHRFE